VSYSIRHLPLLTNNLPNRCYTPLWYSRQPCIAIASLATAAARAVIRTRPLNSTVLWDEGEAGTEAGGSVRLGAYRSLKFQARGSERPFSGIQSGQ
jgi:hypothetical protein